jgi:glycosyltransferase involved in cell wall biosynthesis
MNSPLVSVVMPSFNHVKFIEESIRSVLNQDYPHLELIVADGGSTDGTKEVLRCLSDKDSRIRWFSGKDNGPADAINKALTQARGTVIGWLNSDDLYTEGAIGRAVEYLSANPQLLMIYGHGQHIDSSDQVIDNYPTILPPQPLETFKRGCFICQPTVFFQRSMCVLLGDLNDKIHASFDFDYWLRAFAAFNDRIGFVDAIQAYSRLHEACITRLQRRTIALEGMQLLAQYFGSAPPHWLLTYRDELKNGKATLPHGKSLKQELESVFSEAYHLLSNEDMRSLAAEFEIKATYL